MVEVEGLASVETGFLEGGVFFVMSYKATGWRWLVVIWKSWGGDRLLVRCAVLGEVGSLVVLLYLRRYGL